jgi:hypothetical protein
LLHHFPNVLNDLGASWDYSTQSWRCRAGKNLPDKFIPWLQALPPEFKIDLKGELASLSQAPLAGSVQLQCEEAGVDWFGF